MRSYLRIFLFLLVLLLLFSSFGEARVMVNVSCLRELIEAPEGSHIVVKSVIDFQGEEVDLPKNVVLSFTGEGCLFNGIITGENIEIKLSSGVLDNINIQSGVKSYSKTIRTSSLKSWTPSSLLTLITLCKEGSKIVFDAEFDYTIDRLVRPTVSIKIDGKGKQLTTINKYNYVISLFDVRSVASFELNNLIIDGGSNVKVLDRTVPKEFFMTIIDVPIVRIRNCTIQNLHTAYPNWKAGDDAYTIWVENYSRFDFINNTVTNCQCPEFLKAVLPINNTDSRRIANIADNKLFFYYTSSAVEVRFGRYSIRNNIFGTTIGSTINAYGFDSEIVGNYFHGAHNSASIDLSEYFFFKYVSHDILVKKNTSEYSRAGFLIADNVYNIKIEGNEFYADQFDKEEHDRFDRMAGNVIERQCDRALSLNHSISNIVIKSNRFVGANALLMLNSFGEKKSLRIEANYIENVPAPVRSSLVITQVDGMVIKKNHFINTGRSLSCLIDPQFIVIGPTLTEDSEERYIKSLVIKGNSFTFNNTSFDNAYVLAHTIYDPANPNTLSTLNNISISNNKSTFNGKVLLVSDSFPMHGDHAVLYMNRNRFGEGSIEGNLIGLQPLTIYNKGSYLERGNIVEIDNKEYN